VINTVGSVGNVISNDDGDLLFSGTVETFLNQRKSESRNFMQRSNTKSRS
jgi:hypothetical protein